MFDKRANELMDYIDSENNHLVYRYNDEVWYAWCVDNEYGISKVRPNREVFDDMNQEGMIVAMEAIGPLNEWYTLAEDIYYSLKLITDSQQTIKKIDTIIQQHGD